MFVTLHNSIDFFIKYLKFYFKITNKIFTYKMNCKKSINLKFEVRIKKS